MVPTLSSALTGFSSEFEMGSGGTQTLWPPENGLARYAIHNQRIGLFGELKYLMGYKWPTHAFQLVFVQHSAWNFYLHKIVDKHRICFNTNWPFTLRG